MEDDRIASDIGYPKLVKHRSARFTEAEDTLLKELIKDKKNKTWKEIASFLPGRTACQCRDRYNQYLFKEVVNKPWTAEEDQIIIEKYKIFGPHWVKISHFLPGRSGNNIKNHWNGALKQFHGISHEEIKQERRSKKVKWDGVVENNAVTILPSIDSTIVRSSIIEPPKMDSPIPIPISEPNVIDIEFTMGVKNIIC